MNDEYSELAAELVKLRQELASIRSALGMDQNGDETCLPNLRCKSIKIIDARKEVIHIGAQGGAGLILMPANNGSFLEIQGVYDNDIIRIKDRGQLMVTIGAPSAGSPNSNGSIRTYSRDSKAFAEMRTTEDTGMVETYSDSGELTGQMPKMPTTERVD